MRAMALYVMLQNTVYLLNVFTHIAVHRVRTLNENACLYPYIRQGGYIMGVSSPLFTLYRAHRTWVRNHIFTNLNALLNGVPPLDDDHVDQALQRYGGGYCHEMNTRFAHLLAAQGISVHFMGAYVYNPDNPPATIASHTILQVTLNGVPLLCDVGFGKGFLWPIRLDRLGCVQHQGTLTYRVIKPAGRYVLQQLEKGHWLEMYAFDPQKTSAQIVSECNIYSATSPNSPFTGNLLVTHYQRGSGRHTLFNTRYKRTPTDNHPVIITSMQRLDECLRQAFGIQLNPEEIKRVFAVCKAAERERKSALAQRRAAK